MGDDIQIFLVNRPTDIAEAWFTIREGLEEVQKKGHGEESNDSILAQLISGQLFLWMIFNNLDYLGFFTTKKVFDLYNGNRVGSLIVHHHYQKKKKYDKKLNDYINKFIDIHAKETGCRFIKIYTNRKADRYLNELGYNSTYTEYIKEVLED